MDGLREDIMGEGEGTDGVEHFVGDASAGKLKIDKAKSTRRMLVRQSRVDG
jgi:hypothetical protein